MTKTINDVTTLKYVQGNFNLYFSDRKNLERYSKTISEYIIIHQRFLQLKYNMDYINAEKMLILSHYKNVEKRMFRVELLSPTTKKVICRIKPQYTINCLITKGSKEVINGDKV